MRQDGMRPGGTALGGELRRVVVSFCCLSLVSVGSVCGDDSSRHVEGLHESRPAVWAVEHARIYVSPDVVLDDAVLVIRHGKVEAIGRDVAVPADARAIDLSGKTIYPGIVDAYSEESVDAASLESGAPYWNANVRAQLSMASRLSLSQETNEALRKQGIVARVAAPADGVIRGQSVILSTATDQADRAIIAANAAQHVELTVARRGRSGGYPSSPMGAVALARQAFYDAQWYRDAHAAYAGNPSLRQPETNDALAALQPVLRGTQPIIAETSNELFFLRADRFAAEFGLNLIVRGSGNEYRRLGDIRQTGRAVILPLDFPDPPNVGSPEAAETVPLESLMHWDLAPENPARVDAAGIVFAFCTDGLDDVGDFLKSVRAAVDRGLSRRSALRALTQTPAELFGLSDQLGSLQKGRRASFIVTDGDLFGDDVEITETWVDGRRFEHTSSPARETTSSLKLMIGNADGRPERLYLQLTQTGDEVAGQIDARPIDTDSEEDKPSKQAGDDAAAGPLDLQKAKLTDAVLAARIDTKSWGVTGQALLSLTFPQSVQEQPADGRVVAFGSLLWPDGVVSPVTAQIADAAASAQEMSDEGAEGEEECPEEAPSAPSGGSYAVNYPLGAFGRSGLPEQADYVALTHATIWTSGPQGVLGDATLLVNRGRIVAVGTDVVFPEGCQVIDVRGMHISPGIIDCHSHMATDGGVNEGTQALTCEVRIGDFIDCDDMTIYRQLAGGVTSSNILHGSANPIGGQNQVIKLRWGANDDQMKFAEAPQGVKFALGENVKQSNWSEPTGRYPQTRMGVEQLFRDSFEAARDYARRMDDYRLNRRGLPPRRDLELDALREMLEGTRWIHCHSYRQDEILALIRVLDDYEITIGSFQHILEGYKVADAMAKHGATASAFSDWWAYKFEVVDAIPYAGAMMHEAGVVVSFNSDDGELARHLNQEAAKAVKYGGVDPAEALKFVTLNPAIQLRVDHLVGSLEPGKHADFVVWSDSPLSNYARCEQTWIDGRRYFNRSDDRAERKTVREMRSTLIQKILDSGRPMRSPGEGDDDPAALWPRHDEFCHHVHYDDEHDDHAGHSHAGHSHAGHEQE